jgi:probable F420-dependent oxidoreductase
MKYGVATFITDKSMRPDDLARLVEERGFESLGCAEHTHIPASRVSQRAGIQGELPEQYRRSLDPFVALTAAAMATTRLRLWTSICLVIEHDPIVLAKEVASLDLLSNGRFTFGIGGGWNAEEMGNHGTDFRLRWRILRERILAMKAIWTQDEATFHGRFVDFDRIWSYPKPVQKPHPPVIMGGEGPTTFDRVIEFCDGWVPGITVLDLDAKPDLADKIATLRRRAGEAGRDPGSISVTVFGGRPDRAWLERVAEAGAERVLFSIPSAGRDEVEPALDRLAALI